MELSPPQCVLAAKVSSAGSNNNTKLIGILLYIERKIILKLWISKNTPSTDDWYKRILEVLPLEKLTHTLHDNVKGFLKTRKPVLDMVDPSGMDFAVPD